MITPVKEYLTDLFNLFYPNLCLSCDKALRKGEQVICLKCERELPLTEYWKEPDNPLAKRFWGRLPMVTATALFQFHKGGPVQQLLHHLKYRNRKEVGEYCGKRLGNLLKSHCAFVNDIDLIIPVPLHWKKQKLRGYNQCEPFAAGLSGVLGIPYSMTTLERVHENISQTKKHRFERWDNVAEIFGVKDAAQLEARHILLVDDVVTTGATAEACMQTILSVSGTRISFAAIAAVVRN